MKVLFLISSPGRGHSRCAEAIDIALRRQVGGIETETVDIHSIVDARVSAAIKDGYLRMVESRPALYQRLYDLDRQLYRQLAGELPADADIAGFLAEQQRRWFPEIADRPWYAMPYRNLDTALINTLVNGVCESRRHPANRLMLRGLLQLIYRILAKRLKDEVQRRRPDVLVATQMYPNALLDRAVATGAVRQPLIGVITDYGIHGVWVRGSTRYYCVAHPATADMLTRRGVAANRIRVTGIPLMPAFEQPRDRQQARRELGLDERPTALITGGGQSIGILASVREILADARNNVRLLVNAPGTMAKDRHTLDCLAKAYPDTLKVFDWTDDMSLLMSAADVVVGKPGGLTVSEALACGRPFLATCSLGGQEGHNLRFLEQHRIGCLVPPSALGDHLGRLFAQPGRLTEWQERAAAQGRRHGASEVAELIMACADGTAVREAAVK